jgi:D-3-phosphoglycerate dehydrogenase
MTFPADRPVVLIAEELAPAAIEVLADDFDVRHVDGTDRPALLSALAEANAIIVRSATQVDAEVVAAAPRLRVVARAGVGAHIPRNCRLTILRSRFSDSTDTRPE